MESARTTPSPANGIRRAFRTARHFGSARHGVLFEAAARGIPVPARLAVMGFGDAPISAHTHPAPTTVAVDGARIGREAARLLLERVAAGGRRPARPRLLDVGFTIVMRGTP